MIKFLILYAIGRKSLSPRKLFNINKSYIIIYLLTLPGFLTVQSIEWSKTKPIDFSLSYELINSQVVSGPNQHVIWVAAEQYPEIYGQKPSPNYL